MHHTEVAVIGGGIVGLATAHALTRRHPRLRVSVVEKEARLAAHQTGHNSGVLHSGIYYRPDSLKARNCRDGKEAMEEFCEEEGIPFERCGKVIVATNRDEIPVLEEIYRRGLANGVHCERVGPERLFDLEPHAAGLQAIHVPETGIIDFGAVCHALARRIQAADGTILTKHEVQRITPRNGEIVLHTTQDEVVAQYVVNCGGLHSDRIAAMTGNATGVKIVPFRGEYYKLKPAARHLCRHLIYPVPDPSFPFLGVHFTRMIDGQVECGPNAVLALAREGYDWSTVNFRDLAETLTYPGFVRLATRYWQAGATELWRSLNKTAFVHALQRLVPDIREEDLEPAPAGVRAQAVSADGRLLDDFLISESDRLVHICNAPSPAATASLSIAETIVDRLEEQLN